MSSEGFLYILLDRDNFFVKGGGKMARKKKSNVVENYIEQMENNKWELKSNDNINLIFEKNIPNGKHFKTFMKSGLSPNFMNFMIVIIFSMNIYDALILNFCYTITSYWRTSLVITYLVFLVLFIIMSIREMIYLFKYRVKICDEKRKYIIPIEAIKRREKGLKVEAIVALIVLILGFSIMMAGRVTSKNDTSNVSFNLSLTELNDTIEGSVDNDLEVRETRFAKDICLNQSIYDKIENTYYTDRKDKGYLYVEYFVSDYKWILDRGFKCLYEDESNYTDLKEVKDSEEFEYWDAEKMFVGEDKERILVYENSVLVVDGDLDYNKENIDKILKECKVTMDIIK